MPLDQRAIGRFIGPVTGTYGWKDVVLYALGVGAGFDELDYVWEDRLKVLPSFSIAAILPFLREVVALAKPDLAGILHAEQDIVLHGPIPTSGELTSEGAISAYYDKGEKKGAIVEAVADTWHSQGQKLFTNTFRLFCRRDGGFGGPDAPPEVVEFPQRDPDFVEDAAPSKDQPLLYRLSGDEFRLHVDPAFAKASGFEMPIMHGLCTHGYACRAVIRQLFPGEPGRMSRFKVRFSKTLYPGTPIQTRIWKLEEGRALFRVVNAETGDVVIDRGLVEWVDPTEAALRAARTGIRFDGRVAVVTGGGRGLGRTYALELARRGAKVVVNDPGDTRDGAKDGFARPANEVVDEIRAAGGEAVASYDSVADEAGGQAIIDAALDAFGRCDILIHNAGILRDRSFVRMSAEEWDAVLAVHLDGAFNVCRPAFRRMKAQGYGRVVLTTSAAGLFGNFGQANYGAAKAGQVGLMNTLAIEGARSGIKVNTVAPLAATRLTEDVLPPELQEKLTPEYVTPLVVYLASERCPDTGRVVAAGMGYFGRYAVVQGEGVRLGEGGPPTPEGVLEALDRIADLSEASVYRDMMASVGPVLSGKGGAS
ncbi:MAG: SDR family NAD(P)-dependent oxidoreductase [Pseudomonadota bacterium]